jgi:hypothetical protein
MMTPFFLSRHGKNGKYLVADEINAVKAQALRFAGPLPC